MFACTASPHPGLRTTTVVSVADATSTSTWPTPTVSTNTRRSPAAASSRTPSGTATASPPRCPRVAIERMKTPVVERVVLHAHPVAEDRAAGERRRRVHRDHAERLVLLARNRRSDATTSVDLPAPGAPVIPTVGTSEHAAVGESGDLTPAAPPRSRRVTAGRARAGRLREAASSECRRVAVSVELRAWSESVWDAQRDAGAGRSGALDVRAERAELGGEILVAPVDVRGVGDDGLAVCHQPGEDEGGAGPQVGGAHPGTREPRHAADHGVVALGADVRTHPAQLVDVAEAPGEEVLGDDADAVCDAQHRDEERLVVGGDPRVRQGRDVDALEAPVGGRAEPFGALGDLDAHLADLADAACHMVDPGVLDDDLPARHCGRGEERGRDDPVGDHVVGGGFELSTPSTTIRDVPAPVMRAPMARRNTARSATSGSRAAFSMTVVPLASTAAMRTLSVAVWLGYSSTDHPAGQPASGHVPST